MNIEDAFIEKPHRFTIETDGKGDRHFYLFPVTLGKKYLLNRHIDNLGIDFDTLTTNPYVEALRLATTQKEKCCRLLTYHTFRKKRDIFDYAQVEERVKFFVEHLSSEELASIIIVILTTDNVEVFKKHLGITKENERMKKVLEVKDRAAKSKNNFSFGGKSIYGALVDTACERYGWSYDYVLWGISLTNLQLMLADRVNDIFLSDDEKKKVGGSLLQGGESINADDKANMEKVLAMDWR